VREAVRDNLEAAVIKQWVSELVQKAAELPPGSEGMNQLLRAGIIRDWVGWSTPERMIYPHATPAVEAV
jgi:hypothetical protein